MEREILAAILFSREVKLLLFGRNWARAGTGRYGMANLTRKDPAGGDGPLM
jgi:hypothetical protein